VLNPVKVSNPVLFFKDRFDTLSFAAASAPTEGLILEFGVATGATVNFLAHTPSMRGRTIYGFDSFQGLPERWADYPVGHFACDPPKVLANVELIIGLFSDTISPFLATHDGNAALIHIDCDLYSSTWEVLTRLNSRIVPGTTVAMDEFYIVRDHEARAFNDWLNTYNRRCVHVARSFEQAVIIVE
jgi:hypothetical protein